MGVDNRSLDSSEAKHAFQFNQNVSLTNGETGVLSFVPYPCVLNAVQMAAFSSTNSPNLQITVSRFAVGAGSTTWVLGSTFQLNVWGTSGMLTSGVSLPVAGSTLLMLAPNDVLGYVVGGGANVAINGFAGAFVVTPLQDVKTYFGNLA